MPAIRTTRGVEIAYEVIGAQNNPPVVLIQGLGSQLVGWHPDLCRALADAGHQIIRFDNRDVGLSSKFPGVDYTLSDMAGDVIGLLDALKLDTVHVIGQSLGGMIAQQMVIEHPHRVRSLGLIYTTGRRQDVRGLDALADRMHAPVPTDRADAVATFVSNEAVCSSPRYPQDINWLRMLGELCYDRCFDPAGVNRQFAAMWRSPDRLDRLREIDLPTCIVHGDSDQLVDPAGSRDLHGAIAGSVLTIHPGMGHELPEPLWPQFIDTVSDTVRKGEDKMTTATRSDPVRVALIGSGRMGAFHGQTLATRLPNARLVAVADPAAGAAESLASQLGADRFYLDPADAFADADVDAVVIAAPARFHADLVVAAAAAGKAVFCEKPMATTLADADRAIAAARDAGVPLQVGFNRRFASDWTAARKLLDNGAIGTPRLLRSVTRDPGGFDPSRVPVDTIFLETLIHDFDTLLFLNPGATPTEVYATADALVEPDWKERGLLDTAVVMVKFDNGTVGVAEACFQATYGYDVRGEVFGSGGMATMGDGRTTGMVFSNESGRIVDTARGDQALLGDAYVAELAAFADAARDNTETAVGGEHARAALRIALAAAQSVRAGHPVRLSDLS
jgi:myo-inositol 2-dehydrogenase/D-chiro-inositol 1-dehydrogenase